MPVQSEPVVTTLERLRIDRGWTRLEVQRTTGLDRRTLQCLEQATTIDPRARTVHRLARLYEVEPSWLLGQIRRDRRTRSDREAA
jgi:transcriptional regulator with XRE-family HTH domain